jgi:hypothetical protein
LVSRRAKLPFFNYFLLESLVFLRIYSSSLEVQPLREGGGRRRRAKGSSNFREHHLPE